MRAKTLLIKFEQHVAMATLLLSHLLKDFRGVRIALFEVLGEGHVDAAVLLLGGNRNSQHLAFGQIGEILHRRDTEINFRSVLNSITVWLDGVKWSSIPQARSLRHCSDMGTCCE